MKSIQLFLVLLLPSAIHGQATWNNLGPDGGSIAAVVADHNNPQVLFAATLGGNVFKSTDAGQSWTYLSTPGGGLSTLTIDKGNSNRLYAASFSAIHRSVNGGNTWTSVDLFFDGYQGFDEIVVAPDNFSYLYSLSKESDVILRSTNSGQSWSSYIDISDVADITAFALNPLAPLNIQYLGVQTDSTSEIVRVDNNGTGFTTMEVFDTDWVVHRLFVVNDSAATIHAVLGSFDSTKIVLSNNNGITWQTTFAVDAPFPYMSSNKASWVTTTAQPNQYTVSLPFDVIKSMNKGMTWTQCSMSPMLRSTR